MTGPVVDASALIMHRDGAVQMEPLTCGMRMDCDWRNDYHRAMIARGAGQSYRITQAILRQRAHKLLSLLRLQVAIRFSQTHQGQRWAKARHRVPLPIPTIV